ncbi:restriction endonuclease subunit S [Dietzia psychralcaliphila]|uniref:restriction endonuclease subunit S n=1 Tax=Dietzia psychralcaliphila TaxID=139021 RepID=UPI00132F852B|nr:restriction endonuclease subunit S [Dietzia psychralcaliphila]
MEAPVYSVTKHAGFVPSLEYFRKQVFSRDISKYKVVEHGEFAYATIHLDEGSIGIAPEQALISPMYTIFKVRQEKIDSHYLLRYLKSPRALQTYPQLGQGAVHRRKSIALSSLGKLLVPVPPLDEQRRIAKTLDRSAGIRSSRKRSFELARELQTASFIDLFGSPATWIDRWPMGTIGDITESTQYGTSEKSGPDGTTPVLRMGNITTDGRLDTSDLKYMNLSEADREKFTTRRGDILFNRTNSPDLVGKTAAVRNDEHFAFAGYLIRLRLVDEFEPDFVSGYLNSAYGKVLLRSMCKSIVGQANINAKELRRIPIALPPAAVQREYRDVVSQVERHAALLATSDSAVNATLASLQTRAFRGEL